MDVNSGMPTVGRGRKKSVPTSRRVWTYGEEKELVNALRELVVKGLKCDNGFKNGYLNLLENMLAVKFPDTDLEGDPHINSKIHVWKKQYACLKMMMGVSGIGLNSTTYHIDALPEVWAAHIKADPTARGLKNKSFPFYADWLEIFGNDRATGADSQAHVDAGDDVINQSAKYKEGSTGGNHSGDLPHANEFSYVDPASFTVGESSSATKENSKGMKRKQIDSLDMQFVDTMGNFCDKSDSRFCQIADTMGSIAQRVGSEFDACTRRGQVYEQLGLIGFLTVESRVEVSQYLCNNPKDMDHFFSLPDNAKNVLMKRIMKKLGGAE
ncbi:hypothetical protein ACS0TY_008645 [Phlomoides rotata]